MKQTKTGNEIICNYEQETNKIKAQKGLNSRIAL